VNFKINEQEVLNIRADMRRLGISQEELKQYPIEVGLQTDEGYPYRGTLNYVSPTIERATGTLAVSRDSTESRSGAGAGQFRARACGRRRRARFFAGTRCRAR